MKHFLPYAHLLLALVVAFSALRAQSPAASPDPAPSAAVLMDGQMRATSDGYQQAWLKPGGASNHASNLLETANGDLLCFWFAGSGEGQSGVAIVVSRLEHGQSQWSAPAMVDRKAGYSYQNPVPFLAPDGSIWLLHTSQPVREGQAQARVLVVGSQDGGHSWTQPEVLFDQPGAFVRDPLLVRRDGAWLLPMYYTPTSAITTGARSHYSVVKLSTDAGHSWQECPIPASSGLVQPSVVASAGRFVALFRSRFADAVYRSTSTDGCHWSKPKPIALANNNASIEAASLGNGRLALVFNPTHAEPITGEPATGARVPLAIATSSDAGLSWSQPRVLEASRRGAMSLDEYKTHIQKDNSWDEYSYPSILRARDASLWVAYTYRRQTIKVVHLPAGWVDAQQ